MMTHFSFSLRNQECVYCASLAHSCAIERGNAIKECIPSFDAAGGVPWRACMRVCVCAFDR